MTSTPLILGFDTSAAHCAAALLSGDKILAHVQEDMAKGQAERLMPMLEELLVSGGAEWADLAAIGVGVGPGNFTGIRISVAAARGLALGLSIPAIGISVLEAQALGHERRVMSCVDARGGRVYLQIFDEGHAETAPDVADLCFDALPNVHPKDDGIRIVGAFADPVGEILHVQTAPPKHSLAEAIARIAADRRLSKVPRPAPLYIRPADAAPPRDPAPVILS